MKLKTLKDIEMDPIVEGYQFDIVQLPLDRIRQEAIKYIKDYTKDILDHSHQKELQGPYLDCVSCRNKFIQIAWIKHFFNIKESDFK